MTVKMSRYQLRTILGSFFFIFILIVGIYKFYDVNVTTGLPLLSVVNITADLCSMAMGYVLFIVSSIDRSRNRHNLINYLLLLTTCFLSSFLDELCWIADGREKLAYISAILNTLFYMCAPVMAFLFWRYVVTYLELEYREIKIVNFLMVIGLIGALSLRIINLENGFYFYISSNGIYYRGTLHLLSYLYSFAAIIMTLFLVFLSRKRFRLYQVLILYTYAFFPLVAGLLSANAYGLQITSPVIMLVLLLMYCVLNVKQSRERSIYENELQTATSIQEGVLPHVFPPYPERTEFDLHASMNPAKEVGGDFYDYYMPDDDHLVITIADVSGKGIPAALMMMVTKTLIKSHGLSGSGDTSKILASVNDQFCENNELDMFVTVFLGVLTLSTGEFRYTNAGHEYPAISRGGNKFELIKEHHSPPLGCMEGIVYKEHKIMLFPGDIIYVYTDGVTEANDSSQRFYGEKRLIDALNQPFYGEMAKLDENVSSSIAEFSGKAEQFDDITMLSLKYNGSKESGKARSEMNELKVKADVSELDRVLSFADSILESMDCSMKSQMQIDVAIEEIFVNIAHYAYPSGDGEATINIESDTSSGTVSITFIDQGTPYDPLKNSDPDITLSADDRPIGGLGIFMVKKSMDDVSYEYKDNQNRLTIKKSI